MFNVNDVTKVMLPSEIDRCENVDTLLISETMVLNTCKEIEVCSKCPYMDKGRKCRGSLIEARLLALSQSRLQAFAQNDPDTFARVSEEYQKERGMDNVA